MSTFPKSEKLCSKIVIGSLFQGGKKVKKFPMVLLYANQTDFEQHKIAFSVPKRNFKKAVDRNRIKRQLREIYRLNKYRIDELTSQKLAMFLIYNSNKMPSYQELEKNFMLLLERLKKDVSNENFQ